MSETRKFHLKGRRRIWTVAAATGIVMAAGGVLSQSALAQDNGNALPTITPVMAHAALAHNKIPANAVRAKAGLPKTGAHGVPFQAAVSSRAATYIVGGTLADPTAFPSVVGIETLFLADDGTNTGTLGWWIATCTGTVVSPTKVLTAGHCDTDKAFGTTVVIAGRSNLDTDTGGYVAAVASTWTDQGFNLAALNAGTIDIPAHDVSVITLKTALPAAYVPISLTGQGDNTPYAAGTSATIVGYGVSSYNAEDSGILRTATVNIQSNQTCTTAMPGYNPQTMTCAGLPAGGVDSCFGDSGGAILVNGVQVGITDWGSSHCAQAGTYGVYERLSYYHDAIIKDVQARPLVNLDYSGDGHTDLLARDTSGTLWEYSGSGFLNDGYKGFAGWGPLGAGWNGYTKVFRVTNWNGDGTESIMAETSNGALYIYNTNGAGEVVGDRILVGSSWNGFTDIMVTNNWTGDGHPDLMGRNAKGDLFLYESDGHGGWLNGNGVKIGTSWNGFDTVLTPGDWRGKGQALIGRTPSGDLDLYESDGHGGWLNGNGTKIGTSWNGFKVFLSPGDWNGDDLVDMVGIRPDGVIALYESDGAGNWLTPNGVQLGTGWQGFNTVF